LDQIPTKHLLKRRLGACTNHMESFVTEKWRYGNVRGFEGMDSPWSSLLSDKKGLLTRWRERSMNFNLIQYLKHVHLGVLRLLAYNLCA
jgi:hypothetical protein